MNLVSSEKLGVFVTVLLLSVADASGTTTAPFTAERFVQSYELIIEGVFVSDEEVPIENRIVSSTGWIYPTNWACVVVDSLIKQPEGRPYAAGDTICFRYPSSYKSYHPDKPDLMEGVGGSEEPVRIPIGQIGLYSFYFMNDGECRRGSWFAEDDSRVNKIHDYLQKTADNSIDIVE
jgi:hypothetical protein